MWPQRYRRSANGLGLGDMPAQQNRQEPVTMRRLRLDEPSKAITGGAVTEFLHPTENRYLTVRECARIQTFPDSFRFVGTNRDRMKLIANAVPPLLAERIAESLLADLQQHPRVASGRGELLSFVPTLYNRMSPALQETTEKIELRFGKKPQLME
jgi:DNA (cytosine-5)-methyltransferase 1